MAHKKMKGRAKQQGGSIKKSLRSVVRGLKAEKNRKQAKARNKKMALEEEQPSADEAMAEEQAPAQSEVPAAPKMTKKEAKALASAERAHRNLYSAGERILLVGEGNFSFARALCKELGSGVGVYATAYDGEKNLKLKYTDAEELRKEIEEQLGGTTLVGVDASRLHAVKEFRGAFHKIVWNFPHMGTGETDLEKSAAEHRQLLSGFFKSAYRCLNTENPNCAIHVALKSGEPYKSWKVVQTAMTACPELELYTAVPFATSAWPGYAHRRTAGFDERFSKKESEELAKGAKVYIFKRRREAANSDDD